MPVAGSFNIAAFVASQNAQIQFQGGALQTALTAWLNGIPTAMNVGGAGNPDSAAQRTVYNLIPIGRDLLNSVTNSTLDQFAANTVSVYLNRCCRAIANALSGGRISAAQNVALLALYNATWP